MTLDDNNLHVFCEGSELSKLNITYYVHRDCTAVFMHSRKHHSYINFVMLQPHCVYKIH